MFKFASDVNVDQTTEIARMDKMLIALTLGVEIAVIVVFCSQPIRLYQLDPT